MNPLKIKTDDKRINELRELRRYDLIYIWGSGSYSKDIIDYIRVAGQYEGSITQIVDDAYYTSDKPDVISFSEYLETADRNIPVVFGFYNYLVIIDKKNEWSSKIPHMYDFHLAVVNGKRLIWDANLAKSRECEYIKTYNLLSDERSQKTMQLYLNAATAGEFYELYTACYERNAYFNRVTERTKIDTLIDCGAYDGDSIHDFVAVFPDYKTIIAVEPDPANQQKLVKRIELESICNVEILGKGVGAKRHFLNFNSEGASNSFFDNSGNISIEITTLDDISSDAVGNIFVKMDIEGSELDALRGATNLLRERHPVLAICVYHKEEDLITIPQFIREIVGDGVYNYFLGFHGLDLAELVFYAVPKN